MWNSFLSLIFPNNCAVCELMLYKNEKAICTSCLYQLPKTNYHSYQDNPVAKLFWGRVFLQSATAAYFFTKDNSIQKLMHALKYKKETDIGEKLGSVYGTELANSNLFKTVNTIVPVPLHEKKLKKRGYNQSDFFAKGLSQSMNLPYSSTALARVNATESQTRKSRFKRWENVQSVFCVADETALKNKHVLLVDDVVTTGATIEACANEILKLPNTMVSVATIAFAQ